VLGSFREFSVPTPNSVPDIITAGPDGNVWFTEYNGGNIGRITPSGVVTEFPVSNPPPRAIVAGPDGNLWFAENMVDPPANALIAKMTPNGVVTQVFSLPSGSDPALTLGPDGNIWFTEYWNAAIGRITPDGTITQFPIPYPANDIVTGPDGNLWFDAGSTPPANSLGRITPAGDVTIFTYPNVGIFRRLTVGPDGNLWAGDPRTNHIDRINTAGQLTGVYATPTPDSGPYSVVKGPDGALWFTEPNVSQIGRITVDGSITEYPTPTPNSGPDQLTAGPDGNLWFTEVTSNQIGEIVLSGQQTQPLPVVPRIAIPGVSQAFDLGTFTDPGVTGPWTVQVDWGDQSGLTTFDVASDGEVGTQAHTYGSQGAYTVTETVTNNLGGSATTQFQVVVGPVVVNTRDTGPGSLWQAVNEVNTVPSLTDNGTVQAHVTFDIPTTDPGYQSATGTFVIHSGGMPSVEEPIFIDGWSQPGARPNTLAVGDNAVLPITVEGDIAAGGIFLVDDVGHGTVRGLRIQNFVNALMMYGTDNVIQGNIITVLANEGLQQGVGLFGSQSNPLDGTRNTVLGGPDPADRNVISGYGPDVLIADWSPALPVAGAPGALVEGNYIGTNAAGTGPAAFPGFGDGIEIVDDNNTIEGNLISGNPWNAVAFVNIDDNGSGFPIPVTGNVIEGNLIGTDASGTQPVPNGAGIVFPTYDSTPPYVSRSTTIGGSAPGAGNTIAFNKGPGVWVPGDSTYFNPYGTGVRIEGNSIHDNTGLGIDLGDIPNPSGTGALDGNGTAVIPDGVSSNAANDAANHVGGNDLMNFPVLTSAFGSTSGTTVSRSLDTGTANGSPFLPNATITIDFYANTNPDPSGYGQGQTYLGSCLVSTDGNGNLVSSPDGSAVITNPGTSGASFTASLNTPLPTGEGWVTATATGHGGDTSEFSKDVKVSPTTHLAANLAAAAAPDSANLTLTASDPTAADAQANFSYAINWGDGTTTVSGPGSGTPAPHTYSQDGAYTVSVTATDQDGATSQAATALVVVSHAAGDQVTLGGSFGGKVQLQVAKQAADNGTYGPTDLVYVSGQGGSDTYTVNFGATLTTPVAVVGGGSASGDTLIVNGTPGPPPNYISKTSGQIQWGSPVTETVYWTGIPNQTINVNSTGQNTVFDPGGNTTINGGPGTNTITITATTGNGVVINGGPHANNYVITMGSLLGPVTINSTAGTSTVTVYGPPGSNVLTLTPTQLTGAGQTITLNLGTTATSLTVDGSAGNDQLVVQGTPPGPLTAHNLAPTVGAIAAPSAPVTVTTTISASAPFTELDGGSVTAVWAWGDGNTTSGSVTQTGTTGTVSGSHAYAADGVYTVTLTLTNPSLQTGQSVFQYVVVYNPSAGFVTGGGWFNSPAGALAANPNLSGRATFGLNAKYKSGATVPRGNTEFQFPAGNINFHATSYDWLVITTNQAQYQGSGTINGAGNYGFLVTAHDNGGTTPDLVRMRIWDKNNNAVVYETQPGAPIPTSPTTALGGGRIQVHTNAQLVAAGANASGGNPDPLTPEELRTVVQEAIARWGAAGIDPAQLSALSQVAVGIADFPGPWLGMAFPGAVWIAQDAAGYGWSLGDTPGSVASGKVDLLTVVEHELGHVLGLDDNNGSGLMGLYLAPGVRREPVPDTSAGLAAGPVPGTLAVPPTPALAGPDSPLSAPSLRSWEGATNSTAAADVSPTPTQEVTPNASVLPGIPGHPAPVAGLLRPADPTGLEMARLAEVSGTANGPKEGADYTVSTASAIPARVPAPSDAAGGNLQPVPAAVVARNNQLPAAAAYHPGADTGEDAAVPLVPAPDPGHRADARDVFSRTLPQRGGEPMGLAAGIPAGGGAALRGVALALGRDDGKDGSEVPGPGVESLAAGGPVLFALLGATWGARSEEPDVRKQCRQRGGS
jgi:streptogramin lyase